MPRRLEASTWNEFVLYGVGGLLVFLRLVTDWTTPGSAVAAKALVGLGLVPELVGRVMGLEAAAAGMLELGEELPVGLEDVGAALEFTFDDQAEGRALDAADRKEVGAVGLGDQRDGAGEGGAPDQVDVLAGAGGVGQRVGEFGEVAEGAFDLFLGQGRVAGPLEVLFEVGVDLEADFERFEADQFALAVEVGADDQAVRGLGFLLDRLDHVLLAVDRAGFEFGVDQTVDQVELPLLVFLALGELALDEMSAGSEHGMVAVGIAPLKYRDREGLVFLRASPGKDLGDLLGRVVFLGDDQTHWSATVAGTGNGVGEMLSRRTANP